MVHASAHSICSTRWHCRKAWSQWRTCRSRRNLHWRKMKNMHKDRQLKLRRIRNEVARPDHYAGKTVVMGMLDRRERQVRATVVPNVKRATLQAHILNEV